MNELKLEISGYYSLLNLHKALIEAKFHLNPDNYEVAWSPIIAQICREITELLIQHEQRTKGTDVWSEWLKLSNRPDYRERILDGMCNRSDWSKMDLDTKKKVALHYISPFTCTDADLEKLISDLELMRNFL